MSSSPAPAPRLLPEKAPPPCRLRLFERQTRSAALKDWGLLPINESVRQASRLRVDPLRPREVSTPAQLSVDARLKAIEAQMARLGAPGEERSGLAIVASSGDLDKVLSALTLATGAASMGGAVELFFTFWATAALRKPEARPHGGVIDRVFGFLLPRDVGSLKLSRMNLGGIGTALMRRRMKSKGILGCEALLEAAAELGVRISVCDTTLELIGLTLADLIEYPNLACCGAATFLDRAAKSSVTLFI